MIMIDVRIADLKARLSEHLRSVRNGGTLTVLDRDTRSPESWTRLCRARS